MKKTFFILALLLSFSQVSLAQIRMTLKYPKCDIISQDVFSGIKKYKTFYIESQGEFDKYFKLQEGEKIDFEKTLVLVALVGEVNEDKFIEINAATYEPKAKYLSVRFDIKETKLEDNGKFCVVSVPKSYSFKKIAFLKGKMYNWSQSGE